ncbi:MAG: DUF1971 domain-containing protein [Pseudomonadota bacterium]
MTELPPNALAYKTTPVFTAETVPKALTRNHHTKPGVWGRIEVFSGALDLTRFDSNGLAKSHEALWAGESAICAPGEPHAVTLNATASFSVTFLRVEPAEPLPERI